MKHRHFRYEWYKNGKLFHIDGERVVWQRAGQSGSIVFFRPKSDDQGFYQCRAINIFGVAVSNVFEVRQGSLGHFSGEAMRQIVIREGKSLTLPCKKPTGVPEPSIFWLFRNALDESGSLHFSYVELSDGQDDLIYQCAATSPVLHGEYKSGDEFRLTVLASDAVDPCK
uniref:Ig-like domain-containing protein n=1 Tax=Romanomermis culicivorax TaxID=13658 RepID=A0A915JNG1_ROMCU